MSCKVRVVFFAKARELVGINEAALYVPSELSYNSLKSTILETYSGLRRIESNFILAVNQEYVGEEGDVPFRVRPGDEIAVIPPLSGG